MPVPHAQARAYAHAQPKPHAPTHAYAHACTPTRAIEHEHEVKFPLA